MSSQQYEGFHQGNQLQIFPPVRGSGYPSPSRQAVSLTGLQCGQVYPHQPQKPHQIISTREVGQQTPATYSVVKNPPENYMVWSVLACLFCCCPFLGICAIKSSYDFRRKAEYGDIAGAKAYTQYALGMNIHNTFLGFSVGFVILFVYFISGRLE